MATRALSKRELLDELAVRSPLPSHCALPRSPPGLPRAHGPPPLTLPPALPWHPLQSTERRYTKRLQALCNAYVDPLSMTRIFSAQEVTSVFRNIPMLKNVHQKLSGILAAAVDGQASVSSSVVAVAEELNTAHAALQEAYLQYARSHGEALLCLRSIKARPEAARNLAYIAAQDHRVEGEDLEELLAMPLVHAQSMAELLSKLLGQLSAADAGYAGLLGAMELWSGVGRAAAEGGFGGSGSSSSGSGSSSGAGGSQQALPSSQQPQQQQQQQEMHPSIAQMLDGRNVQVLVDMAGNATAGTGAAASQATQAAYKNALPLPLLPAASLQQQLARADVTTEAVVNAQVEADEAARRLDEMEREVELKERELRLAKEEVARVEAAAASSGANAASLHQAGAIEDSLRTLQEEERELYARMVGSEHRGVYEAFLQRKKDLEEEELRLTSTLAEHEDTLSQIRQRLANPPASVLPTDQAKQALYLAWKRALAEREEYLRQARRRKHDLLKDLKIRFETQVRGAGGGGGGRGGAPLQLLLTRTHTPHPFSPPLFLSRAPGGALGDGAPQRRGRPEERRERGEGQGGGLAAGAGGAGRAD